MRLALVGNQNSGKSTLFNTLTGLNQKIGNWPGVTIEKKTGWIKETHIEVVDLPGIYSIHPYTKEESVTTHFLQEEDFDGFINIVDCNSIYRGLYLTTQLLEWNKPIILVLNMYDLAEKKGMVIQESVLSEALGNIPVIKVSALNGDGLDKLIFHIQKIEKQESRKFEISLEDEEKIEERYHKIDCILQDTIIHTKKKGRSYTDQLDKILLNPVLAFPIFASIMLIIYYIAIEIVGNSTMDKIQNGFQILASQLETGFIKTDVAPALISLIVNGIINGISAVISFLPQLAFLFVAISCLEKIGYLSRVSLLFNHFFKKLGMSGNSVISFLLGTGCSVPGIMATRTIKNEREKKLTAALTSFIPCSAKLPVISLFSTYFFVEKSGLIAFTFYGLAILIIIFSSILFQKFHRDSSETNYISELPEFRLPKWSQVCKDSWERIIDFVKRAGSIIFVSSIVIWILLSYSIHLEYGVSVQDSILADIGRSFSWLFVPMIGKDSWEVAVSFLQGFIAKEQVISSMAIIAGLEAENVSNSLFVTGSPFAFFTPAAAYAYVCFNLFSAPCIGAISAMKKALGGMKNTIKVVFYQIGLAYLLSCLIYQIANLF